MRDTANPKIKQYSDARTSKPRYLVRYRKADGRQSTKRGFPTKRDAEAWLTEIESAKRRGEFIPVAAGRASVQTLWEGWIATKRITVKPSHLRDLEGAWAHHVAPRWGRTPVAAIDTGDVQRWVTTLAGERSASVVRRAHGVLAGMLDDAVRDRLLLRNPARGVSLPRKGRAASRYLSHAQVQAVAEASGHELLVYVLAYCGLRWGEAAALRAGDVNVLRSRITVERSMMKVKGGYSVGTPKSGKGRSVPMPSFVAAMMRTRVSQCESPDDLVFPAPRAEYMRPPRGSGGKRPSGGWWAQALTAAGVPSMRIHDLRHTAASLAVQSGASVKVVQRMLGHASAAMTLDVYADLFDEDLDSVAERMSAARDHVLTTIEREDAGPSGKLRALHDAGS